MSQDETNKDWVTTALALYNEGGSDEEVIKAIGITRSQFDTYCQSVPAFQDLVERGRDYAKAWWLEQGRKAVKEKNNSFPQSLYAYSMANKYGWSNKSESKTANVELNLDRDADRLRQALPEMAKLLGLDIQLLSRKTIEHSRDD